MTMHRRRHQKNNRQTQRQQDLFHKKALKYKYSSLFSLSLSLSWYVKYKKLMNFEVFPKPSVKEKFVNPKKKQTKNKPKTRRKTKQKKCSEKEGKERERERHTLYVVIIIIIIIARV